MSFAEQAKSLVVQLSERRSHVATEEAAKHSLILPFIQLLGFDIHNPREVIPEYKAGWARANEKVDYALKINDALALFIEAKGPREAIPHYDPQLARYFNSTPEVRFAIITNGIQYRFFTDTQRPNLLDEQPFLEFDAEKLSDAEIAILEKFRRETFNVSALVAYAEDLVYVSTLKSTLRQWLQKQSTEFIEMISNSGELVDAPLTQRDIDRFGPQLRESIQTGALDILGERFQAVPKVTAEVPPAPGIAGENAPDARDWPILARQREAFDRIRAIVDAHDPTLGEALCLMGCKTYATVQYGSGSASGNVLVWIHPPTRRGLQVAFSQLKQDRVKELSTGIEVGTKDGGKHAQIFLASAQDLDRLKPALIKAAKLAAGVTG